MPRWFNVFCQSIGLICQLLNGLSPVIEDKYKPFVALALAFLQGMVAIISHAYNPDGTPAEAPYIPKEKARGASA